MSNKAGIKPTPVHDILTAPLPNLYDLTPFIYFPIPTHQHYHCSSLTLDSRLLKMTPLLLPGYLNHFPRSWTLPRRIKNTRITFLKHLVCRAINC
ncbi:hypothetical protein CDAR_590851 [Caerostris darwini]|uniref:Uncharacterized protein n=1 Tax=Caerostris darwini TaxID=1538125 RepID=A0AAV4SI65_9ARAC|nr:hypothetical protein CDAR_590851 [Caerostris darwini]